MPEPAISPQALHEIVQGTAAETGERFFDELVRHLAGAIGTKCAWVTEYLPESRRLRALSFWVEDHYFGDFEYDIGATPCADVVEDRKLIHLPDRLVELYASDPMLAPLGAVSYMGVPLFDTDGRVAGHLAVLHDQPMPENAGVRAVFEIFAARAGAELRRIRREQEVREREQKLSRLIDSAMDAIVELDAASKITGLNRAGETIFGCAAANVLGHEFGVFLTREARGKIAYLQAELDRQPAGRQSLSIPDGLTALRAGGVAFAAEGTLSRFEVEGRPFYTLILRDVEARHETEARIRSLMSEAASLRAEIDALRGSDTILGESPALRALLADVERVAASDATVLVSGETGTGKELVARAIHARSPRAEKPLVAVNCAAIATNLQESELFGHEKGAFTGATQRRDGRFKLAHGGTIFLDEVGEMPLDLQAKLLRVLQEGEFEPVGSAKTERVDVRVIAATNRDLAAMTREGTFRSDLYYRLDVFPLRMPPLRERGDDVVILAEVFAQRLGRRNGRKVAPLGEADKAKLRRYDWPGNVRELQNVIERAVLTSVDGRRLNLDRALPDVADRAVAPPTGAATDDLSGDRILTAQEMRDAERRNMLRALEAAGWKVAGAGGAAELLGLAPNTLASRMSALGIERPSR